MRNQSVRRPAFLHHLDLRSTLLYSLVFRALSHQAIAVLLHTQFSVLLLALSTILAHIFRSRVLFRFRLRTSIMVLDLVFGLRSRFSASAQFSTSARLRLQLSASVFILGLVNSYTVFLFSNPHHPTILTPARKRVHGFLVTVLDTRRGSPGDWENYMVVWAMDEWTREGKGHLGDGGIFAWITRF